MVIDMHVHPAFIEEAGFSKEKLEYNRQILGLYKTEEFGIDQWRRDCEVAKIDRLCILPLALSKATGEGTMTNEQTAELVKKAKGMLIGFASVDPSRTDAVEVLEYAFTDLQLKGLKLHPSKQKIYPSDKRLLPIYQICEKYNKPVIFHSGVSMEPGTLVKYAHPLEFEEVAKIVEESLVKNGIVYVITQHTTTGIMVNENLECLEEDIMENLGKLFPEEGNYYHARFLHIYGAMAGNPTGHLKSMVSGNHCVMVVSDGRLISGNAQEIYLAEFDGPQERSVSVVVMGE